MPASLSAVQPTGVDTVALLLIEDNPGDAYLIKDMLHTSSDADWQLTHVDRLEQGLALLSRSSFDVCILDLNLPDSAADATLAQIVHFLDLPVLVLTGSDDLATGIAALQHGAQDYLVKGQIEAEGLSRAVRYALERFKLEQRFSRIFQHANDAFFIFDPETERVLEANLKASSLLGLTRKELLASSMSELMRSDLWTDFTAKVLSSQRPESDYIELVNQHGKQLYIELLASVVQERQRPVVIVVARDRTEHRHLLSELEFYANHDPVTKLPNRRFLHKEGKRHFTLYAKRGEVAAALIVLGLDKFTRVNDSLGQHVGDALLAQVGERLARITRSHDVLVRLGGDEFAILLKHRQEHHVSQLVDRVRDVFSTPFRLEAAGLDVTASIGVALSGEAVKDFPELLRRASQAMHQAKTEDGLAFYSDDVNERLRQWRWTEHALRKALSASEFELYFQPLVNLQGQASQQAEVLLRWLHPERGMLLPNEFLPVAEEAGLICDLDFWVLEEATRAAELGGFSAMVNVAAQTLCHEALLANVETALAASGLAPERLILEVSERVLAAADTVLPVLTALAARGVRIFIDDLGTSSCSLVQLFSAPIDGVKVDRELTARLAHCAKAERVARTVVGLAKELSALVVMEGVETGAQLDWAKAAGCGYVQGFAAAEPMDFGDCLRWFIEARAVPGAFKAADLSAEKL